MPEQETNVIRKFADLSVEYLHNYLRFHAFPSVPDEKKKKLMLSSISVPLRKPNIFAEVVEAVETKNFAKMQNIVNHNKIDTSSVLTKVLGEKVPSVEGLWTTIIDAYFEESDSVRALSFLRNLIFFEIRDGNPEALHRFIELYLSSKPTSRDFLLTDLIPNAISL
jgi:hypothetical protein